jgi:bacterioferritin-associated ferredoxin
MIVCLCHRISDRDIQREVRAGTTCFERLQDETRVASSCACCMDSAREVFDAALNEASCCRAPAAGIADLALAAGR